MNFPSNLENLITYKQQMNVIISMLECLSFMWFMWFTCCIYKYKYIFAFWSVASEFRSTQFRTKFALFSTSSRYTLLHRVYFLLHRCRICHSFLVYYLFLHKNPSQFKNMQHHTIVVRSAFCLCVLLLA